MRNLKYSKIQITITMLFLIGVPGTLNNSVIIFLSDNGGQNRNQ